MDESVSLREYMDRLLEEKEKAMMATSDALNKRLDEMNELRRQIDSERNRYVTRDMYDQITRLVYIGLGIVLAIQFAGFATIGIYECLKK